jgi:hypothetical protein
MWTTLPWIGLLACQPATDRTEPPAPVAAPAPQVPARPASPRVPALPDRVDGAAAMELAVTQGPGGRPSETLNLVMASRGDGEIEPCG